MVYVLSQYNYTIIKQVSSFRNNILRFKENCRKKFLSIVKTIISIKNKVKNENKRNLKNFGLVYFLLKLNLFFHFNFYKKKNVKFNNDQFQK